MAALRDHDAERASRLALLHKRSVRDSVSTLIDQSDGARPVTPDQAAAAP